MLWKKKLIIKIELSTIHELVYLSVHKLALTLVEAKGVCVAVTSLSNHESDMLF